MYGYVTIHKTTKNLIKNYHGSYLVKYPDVNSNLLSRYITLSILSLSPIGELLLKTSIIYVHTVC